MSNIQKSSGPVAASTSAGELHPRGKTGAVGNALTAMQLSLAASCYNGSYSGSPIPCPGKINANGFVNTASNQIVSSSIAAPRRKGDHLGQIAGYRKPYQKDKAASAFDPFDERYIPTIQLSAVELARREAATQAHLANLANLAKKPAKSRVVLSREAAEELLNSSKSKTCAKSQRQGKTQLHKAASVAADASTTVSAVASVAAVAVASASTSVATVASASTVASTAAVASATPTTAAVASASASASVAATAPVNSDIEKLLTAIEVQPLQYQSPFFRVVAVSIGTKVDIPVVSNNPFAPLAVEEPVPSSSISFSPSSSSSSTPASKPSKSTSSAVKKEKVNKQRLPVCEDYVKTGSCTFPGGIEEHAKTHHHRIRCTYIPAECKYRDENGICQCTFNGEYGACPYEKCTYFHKHERAMIATEVVEVSKSQQVSDINDQSAFPSLGSASTIASTTESSYSSALGRAAAPTHVSSTITPQPSQKPEQLASLLSQFEAGLSEEYHLVPSGHHVSDLATSQQYVKFIENAIYMAEKERTELYMSVNGKTEQVCIRSLRAIGTNCRCTCFRYHIQHCSFLSNFGDCHPHQDRNCKFDHLDDFQLSSAKGICANAMLQCLNGNGKSCNENCCEGHSVEKTDKTPSALIQALHDGKFDPSYEFLQLLKRIKSDGSRVFNHPRLKTWKFNLPSKFDAAAIRDVENMTDLMYVYLTGDRKIANSRPDKKTLTFLLGFQDLCPKYLRCFQDLLMGEELDKWDICSGSSHGCTEGRHSIPLPLVAQALSGRRRFIAACQDKQRVQQEFDELQYELDETRRFQAPSCDSWSDESSVPTAPRKVSDKISHLESEIAEKKNQAEQVSALVADLERLRNPLVTIGSTNFRPLQFCREDFLTGACSCNDVSDQDLEFLFERSQADRLEYERCHQFYVETCADMLSDLPEIASAQKHFVSLLQSKYLERHEGKLDKWNEKILHASEKALANIELKVKTCNQKAYDYLLEMKQKALECYFNAKDDLKLFAENLHGKIHLVRDCGFRSIVSVNPSLAATNLPSLDAVVADPGEGKEAAAPQSTWVKLAVAASNISSTRHSSSSSSSSCSLSSSSSSLPCYEHYDEDNEQDEPNESEDW
jgi:hypothetical protein